MLKTVILAGAGGFIGSIMRYLLQILIEKGLNSTFPWGTLTANILGSFLIGIIFALSSDLPVSVEIVDTPEKLHEFIKKVEELMEKSKRGGLITFQELNVVRYEPGKHYNGNNT